MEGVPLKIPQAASFQEVKDDVKVPVPDYLNILQEAEYEFSLENWVLAGLQSCFTPPQRTQPPSSSSSGPLPSCPPYWMMFSSPQQSRLASRHSSDFWEPNPRQRSHSLNPSVLRAKFTISDSDDEGESAAREAKADPSDRVDAGDAQPVAPCQRRPQRAFVPDLLNPPTCLSSLPHQRRKNLRQCSVTAKDVSTQQESKTERQPHRPPNNRANTVHSTWSNPNALHMRSRKSEARSASPTALPPRGLSSALDSSVELLSALSPEERELLGAITARGYPLRTAIIALQRMGQQTPDQVFSYLVAYEHLCQLGYDMAQVEEALEMFQNCEAKAEEFLHLLSQFNEMGFQQNAIKEVLLVHENHRERALEELMMRVA